MLRYLITQVKIKLIAILGITIKAWVWSPCEAEEWLVTLTISLILRVHAILNSLIRFSLVKLPLSRIAALARRRIGNNLCIRVHQTHMFLIFRIDSWEVNDSRNVVSGGQQGSLASRLALGIIYRFLLHLCVIGKYVFHLCNNFGAVIRSKMMRFHRNIPYSVSNSYYFYLIRFW